MKITETMCHSHLLSMLVQAEEFQRAVLKYQATAPDVSSDGMAGYMETKVEFEVLSLSRFAKLYENSRVYPTDRAKWYSMIRNGVLLHNKDDSQ